jgi:hypothetical protein
MRKLKESLDISSGRFLSPNTNRVAEGVGIRMHPFGGRRKEEKKKIKIVDYVLSSHKGSNLNFPVSMRRRGK